MNSRPKGIANVDDAPPEPYERKGGIGGISRDIGAMIGTGALGVDVTEIPPGKKSSYLHSHKFEEGFFYVPTVRSRIRYGGQDADLRTGDAVSRPAGSGVCHQFSNPYEAPCTVMMLGVMTGKGVEDVIEWPELKRRMIIDPEGGRRIEKG